MGRTRKTIRTTMLTTLVRIHGILHRQILAFHLIHYTFRKNFEERSFHEFEIFIIRFKGIFVETVDYISLCALTFNRILVLHCLVKLESFTQKIISFKCKVFHKFSRNVAMFFAMNAKKFSCANSNTQKLPTQKLETRNIKF